MALPLITWLPSPFKNARDTRYPIRAEVKHRIVGTLGGARQAFGVAPGTSRNASTHFGIGYIGGRLTIDQYVDLSDMAWGNGDVRSPTWSRLIPGVNPNLYTVSTEHEDGGSANRGRVSDEVWQASMELSALLRCGDTAKIRAAGIRVRSESTVAQLAAMPIDTGSYIDHHQIAGPNKPYCFRRWLDDPGFVEGSPSRRDRLLAHLSETPVADIDTFILETIRIDAAANIRSAPSDGASLLFQTGSASTAVSVGTKNGYHAYWIADRKAWGYTSTRANVLERKPYQNTVEIIKEVPTGITQAQLDAAKATATAAGKADMHAKAIVQAETHLANVRALK